MTSATSDAPGAPILPDYASVPRASLGPAVNDQGYYVGRIERNLYWVTDGDYHSAFLTTPDGVVLFDAPPSIGHNLQRAVNEIAAAEGVSSTVTHLVYTHHHSDHAGASSLFGSNVVRIGHEETRRLLLRDNDPAKPPPEETFADHRTLEIGGDRIQLAWHGANHSPDNIYIHFPDHDTLMLVDIVLPGWAPFYGINLSEDVPGYMAAPATALSYPWKHLIAGHLGRWAPATMSPCTSSTSPTSKPAPGRHSAQSTPRRTSPSTATTSGPRSRASWTRWRRLPPRPSSRSTPACWEPWTSSQSPPPFRSWNRSASTSATAWTSTPEQDD